MTESDLEIFKALLNKAGVEFHEKDNEIEIRGTGSSGWDSPTRGYTDSIAAFSFKEDGSLEYVTLMEVLND